MVKTSLKIPDSLWEEAKIRAAKERKNLADVVADALVNHLKRKRATLMAFVAEGEHDFLREVTKASEIEEEDERFALFPDGTTVNLTKDQAIAFLKGGRTRVKKG